MGLYPCLGIEMGGQKRKSIILLHSMKTRMNFKLDCCKGILVE